MASTQADVATLVVDAPVKKSKTKQSKTVDPVDAGAVVAPPAKKAKHKASEKNEVVDTPVPADAKKTSKKAKLAAPPTVAESVAPVVVETAPVVAKKAARASKKATAAEPCAAVQTAGCPFAEGFVKALTYMLQNPVPNPVVQGSIIAALTFATGDNYADPVVKGGILAAIIADTN